MRGSDRLRSPEGLGGGAEGAARQMRLGERLISEGLITPDQLDVALHEKTRSSRMLGAILVDLGFISDQQLASVLSAASGHGKFDAKATLPDPEVVRAVPKSVAQRHGLLPLYLRDGAVAVAMADPYDVLALDQVRRYFPRGTLVHALFATQAELTEAIDSAYGYEISIDGIVQELQTGKIDLASIDDSEGGYSHPIVRLCNALLMDAVKLGASDLHFEPDDGFVRLRYRIDGAMTQIRAFHKDHWPGISHRVKIMAGMNIADKLNPQDGRISLNVGGREVDFRVSSLPMIYGENIVLRTLDKTKALVPLDQLGFSEANRKILYRILKRPEGIIIQTGPTGSGKTTTLYAMLSYINTMERNIMTLEDPVEYELPLIRQTQVREHVGVSFADGIRTLLRQDPDVIFVGEVRDEETAVMALRAGMTGHQVFTTLHTNDAIGAIPRLVDLGVPINMLAGNIIAILAQRLVRKLCQVCKEPGPATEEECRILGANPAEPPVIYHPKGCPECRGTGLKGRIAVAEILPVDQRLDDVIAAGGVRSELRRAAAESGFRGMADDGIEKVLAGLITIPTLIGAVDMTDRL